MICAEGYVFMPRYTRRGYIGTGLWTPQFVLDYPEVLREAVTTTLSRAGSDVVQALQVGEEDISTSPCAIHVFVWFPNLVLCSQRKDPASWKGGFS